MRYHFLKIISWALLIISLSGCDGAASYAPGTSFSTEDVLSESLKLSELPPVDALPLISDVVNGDVADGETIKFGGYSWIVLDAQDDKALILSERIIEHRAYNELMLIVKWEDCDLREYLNTEFFDVTFNENEKSRIMETIVINDDNSWYGTDGGRDTIDRVFLLSINEVVRYFGDSGQLENRPENDGRYSWMTDKYFPFIDDKFNYLRAAMDIKGVYSWWWLRSPGFYDIERDNVSFAAVIGDHDGYLWMSGCSVFSNSKYNYTPDEYNGAGVRPALWLDLRS